MIRVVWNAMRLSMLAFLMMTLAFSTRHDVLRAALPETGTLSPGSTLVRAKSTELELDLWDALAKADLSRIRALSALLSGRFEIYRLSKSSRQNVPVPGIREIAPGDIGPWLACGLHCPFEVGDAHPDIETAYFWILMPLLENLLQHAAENPCLILIRRVNDEKQGEIIEFVTLDSGGGFRFPVLLNLGRNRRFPHFAKMRTSHFGTGQGLAQAMDYADEMEILSQGYRWTLERNNQCTLGFAKNGIPGTLIRARLMTRSSKRRRTNFKNRINAYFSRMKTPSPFPRRKIRVAC